MSPALEGRFLALDILPCLSLMAKARCRDPESYLSLQYVKSVEAHGVSLIQTKEIRLWYLPFDVFILRITSDVNEVPHLTFALSPVSMHHTLFLCFHQQSTQTHVL